MFPKQPSVFQDLLIRRLLPLRNERATRCLQSEIFLANSSELWCDEVNCDVTRVWESACWLCRPAASYFRMVTIAPPPHTQCVASWMAGTVCPRPLRNLLTRTPFKLRTPHVRLIVTAECMDYYELPQGEAGGNHICLKWALRGF